MDPKETPTPIPVLAPTERPGDGDEEEVEDEDVDAGDWEVVVVAPVVAVVAAVVDIVVWVEELVVVVGSPEFNVWAISIALSVPQRDEELPQHQVDELAVPSQGVMTIVELEMPTPGFYIDIQLVSL